MAFRSLRRQSDTSTDPASPVAQAEEWLWAQTTPYRLFFENFNSLRDWWWLLIPILAWYFRRTYQQERMSHVESLIALAEKDAETLQQTLNSRSRTS